MAERTAFLKRPMLAGALVALVSELIFLVRLGVPNKLVFDEVHYVPAARAMRDLSGPTNIEHPLLAKELIALSMAWFGDVPFGWRFASTVAGAATVAGVFALVQLLTGRVRASLIGAALAFMSFTVFVQARIAMLDTFLAAFLLWGIVVLAWSARAPTRGHVHARWCAGAALLGLATACKWTAGPYVAFAAVAYLRLRHGHPERWRGLNPVVAIALLGIVSVGTYLLTFAPAFFYTSDPMIWSRLIPFQLEMYARQTQVLPPHTYQSNWYTWPLMQRPIWYLYEPVDGVQRGIWMIGNPAIMWGGLVAVATLFWAWVKTNSAQLLAPALLWVASLLIWALIPKSLGFYYYYFPSGIFLVVALAVALDHWRTSLRGWDELYLLVCFALLVYFLPVLCAEPLTDAGAFRRWTWFSSWV
ncbi:Dolichyl-phosphate-mannose-protein mannosyltransferase [Sphingomonas palmae]|uniref:Polyprenol-phosphate-mannose--protein mannosyltransferase n=1 Tax=Sphingomonas palmae TaxID=1855283 RepID=A0A1H7PMA7_9SPHN|nr:glycosyltransferase family 39 protein [Sphingomonas palmae]SEL36729.1 Dolichyl-phosphate-mannose-protein mannosyltransferase [Sphingomonas palmae]